MKNKNNYFKSPVNLSAGEHISIEISNNGSMFALMQGNIEEVTDRAIKITNGKSWLWLPKKTLLPAKYNKDIFKENVVLPNCFTLAKWFRTSDMAQEIAMQQLTHIGQPGGIEATVRNDGQPKSNNKKYGPEAYVHFIGPESDINHEHDEIPAWFVSVNLQEDNVDESTIRKFNNYYDADNYAYGLSERLGIELVDEAMRA